MDQGLSSSRYDFFGIALASLGGLIISLFSAGESGTSSSRYDFFGIALASLFSAGELGTSSTETTVGIFVSSESFLRLNFR